MKGMLEKSRNLTFVETPVTVKGALSEDNRGALTALKDALCK